MTTDPTDEATTRCIATLERSLGDTTEREGVLAFLARAIEIADEERPDGWYLRATTTGVALVTGRLEAFGFAEPNIEFSVIGPVDDELRGALGAEPGREVWNVIPGGIQLPRRRCEGRPRAGAHGGALPPVRRGRDGPHAPADEPRPAPAGRRRLDGVAGAPRAPAADGAPPSGAAEPDGEVDATASATPTRRGRRQSSTPPISA